MWSHVEPYGTESDMVVIGETDFVKIFCFDFCIMLW